MLLIYVMFCLKKNYMLSTLVILKLMYDCARHSDSGSEPEFVNVLRNPGIDSTESTPPAYVATGGPVR
jgi:hypothetical protein